jgi:hypothetical protein
LHNSCEKGIEQRDATIRALRERITQLGKNLQKKKRAIRNIISSRVFLSIFPVFAQDCCLIASD